MCDLNIIVYENGCKTPDHEVLACIRKAFQLGFHTLALNVIVGESELSSQIALPKPIKFDIPDLCLKEARSQGKKLRLLTRLSGKVADIQQAHKLQHNPVSQEYDLLAAWPTTDALLNSIINQGGVDILYCPLTENCVMPKYSSIDYAIDKGIYYELPYTSLLGPKRSLAMKGMRRLMLRRRFGFIFSSATSTPDLIRGALDVTFLGHLLDLSPDEVRGLVWDMPEDVILHSETRLRKERAPITCMLQRNVPRGERWLLDELQFQPRNPGVSGAAAERQEEGGNSSAETPATKRQRTK